VIQTAAQVASIASELTPTEEAPERVMVGAIVGAAASGVAIAAVGVEMAATAMPVGGVTFCAVIFVVNVVKKVAGVVAVIVALAAVA